MRQISLNNLARTSRNQKGKIRSTKSEIQNNIKIQMFKIQKKSNPVRGFFLFRSFEFRPFEFVSNFDIRISDLKF